MKFETHELPLASALLTVGFVPSVEKINERQYLFTFTKTPDLQKAIDDYWSNVMSINPKHFWNSVRELKARMHE